MGATHDRDTVRVVSLYVEEEILGKGHHVKAASLVRHFRKINS